MIDLDKIEFALDIIDSKMQYADALCDIFNTDLGWCKSRQIKYKTVGLIQHDRILNGRQIK